MQLIMDNVPFQQIFGMNKVLHLLTESNMQGGHTMVTQV